MLGYSELEITPSMIYTEEEMSQSTPKGACEACWRPLKGQETECEKHVKVLCRRCDKDITHTKA